MTDVLIAARCLMSAPTRQLFSIIAQRWACDQLRLTGSIMSRLNIQPRTCSAFAPTPATKRKRSGVPKQPRAAAM
jgi:hypothetical protein